MRRIDHARIVGVVLFVLAVGAAMQQVRAGVPHVMLAFCYVGVFVAAIGFLVKRVELVYAYVAVALIAQVPFAIDLSRLYLGMPQFIGLVDYDPARLTFASRVFDVTVHLITLPIALVGLALVQPSTYRRFVSVFAILAVVLFALSFTLTGSNCTRIGCFDTLAYGDTLLGHSFYASLIWLVLPLIAGYGIVRAHSWLATSRTSSKSSSS